MGNFLLFKQTVCLLLFVDFLFLLPNFYIYFGKQNFKKSWLDTPKKAYVLAVVILVDLMLLFFNIYPLITSFILCICMRYCYVTNYKNRLLQGAGAVGHTCYFTTAYLFIFELGYALDPLHLPQFFHEVFAYEIGLLMVISGLYKGVLGYMQNEGIEYGFVNPMWGKFYKLFRKIPPKSLFFRLSNWLAFLAQVSFL